MEPQKGLLHAAPVPALTLPPLQQAPTTQSSSQTGQRTPPTSPDEPMTPPPSPASLAEALPSSPNVRPTPPPAPQAPVTLVPQPNVQELKKIVPCMPMLRIPMILTPPSNLRVKLQQFWEKQNWDIEHMVDIKSHELPLSRVRRIMKSDEPLIRVVGEVPALFSKACEMFISELTLRGWFNVEENRRRTLSRFDIAEGTYYTDTYDFLVDILPWDRNVVVKEAVQRSVGTIGNNSYTENGGTSNAIGRSSRGGMNGMGASFTNPAMRQRVPGRMLGPNSTDTETCRRISTDVDGNGFVGMRYQYLPVAPTNLFPPIKRGEASSSQSSGILVPAHAPYGTLVHQPNQTQDDDESNK